MDIIGKKKIIFFSIIIFSIVFFLFEKSLAAVFPGIDSPTFEQRKQAYINDQGNSVSGDFPFSMRIPIFAWLEAPAGNAGRISQEIGYLTSGGDECADEQKNWTNCWYTGDMPNTAVVSYIYFKYYQDKKVISDADAEKIKDRLYQVASLGTREDTAGNFWGCDGNYFYRYLAAGYLYATRIGGLTKAYFKNVESRGCSSSFSYNGRTYVAGNYYDAKQFYSDYLGNTMDMLLANGDDEDFGNYYYSQIQAIASVYDFAPEPEIKKKAKMLLDWLIFNHAISFSAGHPAGGHGRTYMEYHARVSDNIPWSTFFYLDKNQAERLQMTSNSQEFYISSYRFPELLRKIFEKINGPGMTESDGNYYRIVRGNDPRLGCEKRDKGEKCYRYDYVTPYYNLGGSSLGTGWELNIKSDILPFRLWINYCDSTYEIGCNGVLAWGWSYLTKTGAIGYQYKNSIFYSGGGKLHQDIGAGGWWSEQFEHNYVDNDGVERKWQFFRKDGVAVVTQARQNGPSALEVVKIGADYPSFGAFVDAVKKNAKLTWDGFTNSKGFFIGKGFVDYGSDFTTLPFDRLEAWEGYVGYPNSEKKIVDWNNNVMTVSQGDKYCKYDFTKWTEEGNACEGVVDIPTTPIAKADINCDSAVDVQDFGILLSNWNLTTNLTNYLHNQCSTIRSLDLIINSKIDASDISKLFSCWGVFPGACQ